MNYGQYFAELLESGRVECFVAECIDRSINEWQHVPRVIPQNGWHAANSFPDSDRAAEVQGWKNLGFF